MLIQFSFSSNLASSCFATTWCVYNFSAFPLASASVLFLPQFFFLIVIIFTVAYLSVSLTRNLYRIWAPEQAKAKKKFHSLTLSLKIEFSFIRHVVFCIYCVRINLEMWLFTYFFLLLIFPPFKALQVNNFFLSLILFLFSTNVKSHKIFFLTFRSHSLSIALFPNQNWFFFLHLVLPLCTIHISSERSFSVELQLKISTKVNILLHCGKRRIFTMNIYDKASVRRKEKN